MYDFLFLDAHLSLNRCSHCSISRPTIELITRFETASSDKEIKRTWGVYKCTKCGGVITASSNEWGNEIDEVYPRTTIVDSSLPEKARVFLSEANETIHSPSGSIMLSASCVDAMLKAKGYIKGSLYSRIEEAVKKHLITKEMGEWAHQVRLDANDERHADENSNLPKTSDAKRLIEFTTALAQILFVLPALVDKGLKDTKN